MPESGELRASLVSAKQALTEARWDDALALLEGCEAWPIEVAEHAVLVKADTLTRRDAGNALAWLASTDDVVESDEARFQRELLTGRAYANARNFDSASARFERARRYADRVADGPARLAYHLARMRWFRRTGSADGPDIALALTNPDPTGRVAALAIRAWLHASAGNFALQIADFRAALDIVMASDHACDVGTVTSIIHALARVAFETADQAGVEAAQRAYDYVRWTESVRVDRFQTVRILGMDAYVRGDAVRAQWLLRDATHFAPSPAWQALAHLDRALVAQFAGNDPWALDEIETAAKLAHGVPWGEMYGEERFALVGLAVMLAPIDISRSQRFAATFSRVGMQNVAPIYGVINDVRAVGYEKYAFGKIEQTLGNRDAATSSLVEAYNVFAIINYHFQSMLCAKALAEVTGDDTWTERARGHVAHYPGSQLMREGQPHVKKRDTVVDGLTPFQLRLARAHWAGLDVVQLSRQFSRSAYTIEHQIQAIYDAFNVRNASGLREVARKRGLV